MGMTSVTPSDLAALDATAQADLVRSGEVSPLEMVEAEPVDDLGTEAYWDDTVGLVIPLEGRDWYLQVLTTDGGADLETSVQVAEIALERLGG